MFKCYDDIYIISNDLTQKQGITLIFIVHNEIYMLPAFLEHYRTLGIERFIALDDRSNDGTLEFLSQQRDVMVVGSTMRYGDLIAPNGRMPMPDLRSNIVWRNVLMWKYGFGRWTMMLDADEFLILPPGMTIQNLVARASEREQRAIMGIMLDVYPLSVRDLQDEGDFQPSAEWFFDGQQHLQLGKGGFAKVTYPGARARLLAQNGIKKISLRLKLRNLVKKPWYPPFNNNSKIILHRWGDSDIFLSAHRTTAPVSDHILLPIKHYKFTSHLYKKVKLALSEKRYAGGSIEYKYLSSLISIMAANNKNFGYRYSKHAGNFDNFSNSGNAIV